MKRSVFVFAFAAALCAAATEGEKVARRGNWKPTPEELAREDEEYERETGGQLYVEPSGPAICIYDCRSNPSTNVPARVVAVLGSMYRFPATNAVAELECGIALALAKAEEWRKRDKALMAIVLADGNAQMPALTVCPEERIAVVNCGKAARFAKDAEADARLIKETWRAIGFISGAGFSVNDASVMQPVGSPLELDAVEWQVIHPMSYKQMAKFFKKFGVNRGRNTTYRKAAEEGWAQPPTNDVQRAVWDEIHAAAANNAADNASAPAAQ